MPLRSQAQRRFLWATNPTVARKFEDHTVKGTKLPERVGDKKPDAAADKKAFAAAFILKCAAAGVTEPAAVAEVARRTTAMLKAANPIPGAETAGSTLGTLGGAAATTALAGSIGLPMAAGFGLGGIGGWAKNKMDQDDAESLRIAAQANAYRRRAAVAAAHAQVRKLLADNPGRYAVLG